MVSLVPLTSAKVTLVNAFEPHEPSFGTVKSVVALRCEPLNLPSVTRPVTTCVVGLPFTPVSFAAIVEVPLAAAHTILIVPLTFPGAPARTDEQLLALPNLRFAESVPAVTAPPTQPPTLAPLINTVGLTFVGLTAFGSPGVNVATPLADLH